MALSSYPVHVDAHIDPSLSRWRWLFKWLLAVPHYVVLAFLWVAFVALSVIAFFAILLTGRYPRGIFDFNVGVLRWTWRVQYYAYGALGTDRYPPFTLEERPDYPAHLEIEYPARLSRGLVLVKWWLLALPHYLVVGFFLGGVGWAASDHWSAGGGGLIGLLVLVAAIVLLVSGRYPRSIFDLVLGLNRWVLRVAAYAGLMTDAYPPFRLDQGGDDPTLLRTSTPVGPAEPGPHAAPWPTDPGTPGPTADRRPDPPAPASPARPWTAGRVIALVAGCVLVLGALGVGLAGGALAVADRTMRDGDGFLMSGTTTLSNDSYAIVSTSVTLDSDVSTALPHDLLGDVKVTAEPGGGPLFLGIAATGDVDRYLAGVAHATVTDLRDGPVYDLSGSSAPAGLPATADIWVAQSSGSGTRQIVWPARTGDWTLVVMNADGSRGVTADVAAGATVPALDWLVPVLLVGGGLGLVAAIAVLVLAVHRPADVPSR